jgi:hypothetical protein
LVKEAHDDDDDDDDDDDSLFDLLIKAKTSIIIMSTLGVTFKTLLLTLKK